MKLSGCKPAAARSLTATPHQLLVPAPVLRRPVPFLPPLRTQGCSIRQQHQGSRVLVVRRAEQDAAGADGIVFGKPMAPKELYEAIARQARQGLMAEVVAMDIDPSSSSPAAPAPAAQGDVVMAALHMSSEDDAIKTRTHIPLPVEAFSARLDNLATEVRVMLPADLSSEEQLSFITHYVFNKWGLKVAKSMEDGLYSPYRVYMHQVLAQRCGTQVAVAAILHSLFARLRKSGVVSWQAKVGLPADVTAQPTTMLLQPNGKVVGGAGGVGLRWVTGRELVAELLDQLKKAYWSWDWPLGVASGFDSCARGLLGEAGRAGRVNPAVGVMQARGRPFGDVTLAMLSTERLCLVTRVMGQNTLSHQLQVRDFATQLLHVGRCQEGLEQLEEYLAWTDQDPSRKSAAVAAVDLTRALVLEEKRRLLEGVLAKTSE